MCKQINYSFNDLNLFEQALIHSSLKKKGSNNNERMEFLGDRILGFVIAEYLFRHYPAWPEGVLALNFNALVCRDTCAEVADSIGLGRSLIMGKSESKHGGRSKKAILADGLEALIAAIFLDSNIGKVQKVIEKLWHYKLDNLAEIDFDPKTALQHWVQARGMKLPHYLEMSRDGPDHEPNFVMEVKIENGFSAIGKDKSKRAAEKEAAKILLADLKKSS